MSVKTIAILEEVEHAIPAVWNAKVYNLHRAWIDPFDRNYKPNNSLERELKKYGIYITYPGPAPKIEGSNTIVGGNLAEYCSNTDTIRIPYHPWSADYSALVLLHEIIHSTGNKARLNRPIITDYGNGAVRSSLIVREEITAMLGALFILSVVRGTVNPSLVNIVAIYLQLIANRYSTPLELQSGYQDAIRAIDYLYR